MYEIEDKTYRLEELNDSFAASILSINELIEQQKLLGKILQESEHCEIFEKFLVEQEEMMNKYDEQLSDILFRKEILEKLLSKISENEEYKSICSMLMSLLIQ